VQAVLFDLRELMVKGLVPNIPVFSDSPMAIKATDIHRKHYRLLNAATTSLFKSGIDPFSPPRFAEVANWKQSLRLDEPASEPIIIIGSSGMAAGGRIVQHLEKRLSGSNNTVIFVGYQGTGTLGQILVSKASSVKIHGRAVSVKASIDFVPDYSGHADFTDILSWLAHFDPRPKNTFLVHGSPEALSSLKKHIEKNLGWNVTVPKARETFILD
jgi:metallo-beta-lactamase family protein